MFFHRKITKKCFHVTMKTHHLIVVAMGAHGQESTCLKSTVVAYKMPSYSAEARSLKWTLKKSGGSSGSVRFVWCLVIDGCGIDLLGLVRLRCVVVCIMLRLDVFGYCASQRFIMLLSTLINSRPIIGFALCSVMCARLQRRMMNDHVSYSQRRVTGTYYCIGAQRSSVKFT